MGNNISYKKDFGLVVVGAILFTASFLWIDFLKEVGNIYFPKTEGLTGRFIYVIVITLALILVAVLLRRYFGLNNEKPKTDESGNGTTMEDIGIKVYGMDNEIMCYDNIAPSYPPINGKINKMY